jgi:hypothetical protein
MLYGAEVTACPERQNKYCGQNVQFLNVKPVGASSKQLALKS